MKKETSEKLKDAALFFAIAAIATFAMSGIWWLFVRGDFLGLCSILFFWFTAPWFIASIFILLGMLDGDLAPKYALAFYYIGSFIAGIIREVEPGISLVGSVLSGFLVSAIGCYFVYTKIDK